MTNEQELAEAVDRLREGEAVMDLNLGSICYMMSKQEPFVAVVLSKLADQSSAQEVFEEKFNEIARYELREAYRTKLEHEAGL